MKESIKNIILEYCEGISHLEFDADKLDEIAERIEQLKIETGKVIPDYCKHPDCILGVIGEIYGEKIYCPICRD